MRAWHLHDTNGPSSYRFEETPTPEPGSGQVRVRLGIAALNHLDLWISMGMPKPRHFPHIAGADGAGLVDAVGEGVEKPRVGDEVMINPSISCGVCAECQRGESVFCRSYAILGEHLPGTLAEFALLPAGNAVAKPTGLDWETAGSFGLVTGTAYRMLRRARLQAGETLLVVGVGGGVSSAASLVGKAMGARVFVTSRSPDKIAWAIEHGAEAGFTSDGDFSSELRQTAGTADVVIENVGPATWDQSVRSLGFGGRLIVCGSTSGTKVDLKMPVLFYKQLEIIGSTMFTRDEYAEVLELVSSGAVRPPVDRIFAFEDLPAALARLESGEQLGKVALVVDPAIAGDRAA